MPLLTDSQILAALRLDRGVMINNEPLVDPEDPLLIHPILDERQIFGTKVELRLDNEVFRFKQLQAGEFDLDKEIILNDYADKIIVPYGQNLALHPGELMAGYTFEFLRMPGNMMGRMEPRARLAKMGLITAMGTIDPGYENPLLLLFLNSGRFPLFLRPLMRVVSISINVLRAKVKTPFQQRPTQKPVRFDPDKIVLNQPDFDSKHLKSFIDIVSQRKKPPSAKP